MRTLFRGLLCAALVLCLAAAPLFAGAEGTDLAAIQKRLIALDYEIGTADGILGPKTSSAILLAQTLLAEAGYDVLPTGNPDAKTAELIMEDENRDLLRTLLRGSWGSRVKKAQERLTGLNLDAEGKPFTRSMEAMVITDDDCEELGIALAREMKI